MRIFGGGGPVEDRQVQALDGNNLIRWLLFLLAAALVLMMVGQPVGLAAYTPESMRAAVFALFFLGTAVFHLYLGHKEMIYLRNRRIVVVMGLILLQLALARLGHWMASLGHAGSSLLMVPMALSPVVLCVLFGQRMGIFAAIYGSLLTATVVDAKEAFLFINVGLGCGLVGIAATRKVRKRSQLVRAGFYVGIAHMLLAAAFGVMTPVWVDVMHADWTMFLTQAFGILGVELGTVILFSGLLPVFEGTADVTTDISWIEMADLNHPLLKRMTIEAPGTYHHSLVVGILAESAAEAVGANATMVRVCSYFHDIGKLENPGYFIENIGVGQNPHDQLTPSMSAMIIIAHVKDGMNLGRKHKLNRMILDGICQHHGDSLVAYFHNRAKDLWQKQMEEVAKGMRKDEDVCQIDEREYRYPGPRPCSKETAILSLADAVESASRTLREHSPKAISGMVERIFELRMRDGQLADAPLTMSELNLVRDSFVASLSGQLHGRVPYPVETVENGMRGEAGDDGTATHGVQR